MKPWDVESEIIYCEQTPLGDVDLHNGSDLLEVLVDDSSGAETVLFRFHSIESGHRFEISFSMASEIEITRAEKYDLRDETMFHAFEYLGNRKFSFEAETYSGSFTSSLVSFKVTG